ncbi:pyridoxamine 5'-phosphate oxidase family protein [Myxococcota bacterium]
MESYDYFEKHTGFGVLSTADTSGKVNAAVYARPHVFEDGTLGFLTGDRLTRLNLQSNGQAVYLFREEPVESQHYLGKRLYLKLLREETDAQTIDSVRRRRYGNDKDGQYLLVFEVVQELPLIGPGSE